MMNEGGAVEQFVDLLLQAALLVQESADDSG